MAALLGPWQTFAACWVLPNMAAHEKAPTTVQACGAFITNRLNFTSASRSGAAFAKRHASGLLTLLIFVQGVLFGAICRGAL